MGVALGQNIHRPLEKEIFMVLFQATRVEVKGTDDDYQGTALFSQPIANAEVALRGLNLTGYTDGSLWHFRGVTQVQITSVSVVGTAVKFTFAFNFSEGSDYQMLGDIDFLVIANTQ
jgi:hypothetical protein